MISKQQKSKCLNRRGQATERLKQRPDTERQIPCNQRDRQNRFCAKGISGCAGIDLIWRFRRGRRRSDCLKLIRLRVFPACQPSISAT